MSINRPAGVDSCLSAFNLDRVLGLRLSSRSAQQTSRPNKQSHPVAVTASQACITVTDRLAACEDHGQRC